MKSFILFFFISGLILIIMGYYKDIIDNNTKEKIVYKYIPTNSLDTFYDNESKQAVFNNLFQKKDPWSNSIL